MKILKKSSFEGERGTWRSFHFIKRPARDACLCMGDLQAPPALPAPHFVFLITL